MEVPEIVWSIDKLQGIHDRVVHYIFLVLKEFFNLHTYDYHKDTINLLTWIVETKPTINQLLNDYEKTNAIYLLVCNPILDSIKSSSFQIKRTIALDKLEEILNIK